MLVALSAMGLLNMALMTRALAPIERLRDFVRDVDPQRPGQRAPEPARESEAAELAVAFNDMLDRLERERHQSVRTALAAQESERLRVAQELHDEVGQSLTAVLLQLRRLDRSLDPGARPVLADAQETARASLQEVRRIARSLRPEALDDLGLVSALRVKLIAEGYTSKAIGEELVISEETVERHRSNILEKLGMRDRVELTRYAIRRGLVDRLRGPRRRWSWLRKGGLRVPAA